MTRHSEGASSSQSASSAVPSRLLLNCFPPFTFQVPTATHTGLKFVNSDWRSDMALRILGVTIGDTERACLSHPKTHAFPLTPPETQPGLLPERDAEAIHRNQWPGLMRMRLKPTTSRAPPCGPSATTSPPHPSPSTATRALTSGHRDTHPPRSRHDPTEVHQQAPCNFPHGTSALTPTLHSPSSSPSTSNGLWYPQTQAFKKSLL